MPTSRPAFLMRSALFALSAYRNLFSPIMLHSCRFFPSCSAYAQEAIERHGALRGTARAVRRLLRCHPLSRGGADPVT